MKNGTSFGALFICLLVFKLPPTELSCLKLWLRENFRSSETQKFKGVKVTRKVKTVKQKFCIKKTHVYNNSYELRSTAIKHRYKSAILSNTSSMGWKFWLVKIIGSAGTDRLGVWRVPEVDSWSTWTAVRPSPKSAHLDCTKQIRYNYTNTLNKFNTSSIIEHSFNTVLQRSSLRITIKNFQQFHRSFQRTTQL